MKTIDIAHETRSPQTLSSNIQKIDYISCDHLIQRWQQVYQIDISQQLAGLSRIERFRCPDSGLLFFYPSTVAGNGEFYTQLERFDWYYMPNTWEHDFSIKDILPDSHVL